MFLLFQLILSHYCADIAQKIGFQVILKQSNSEIKGTSEQSLDLQWNDNHILLKSLS